MQKNVGHVVVVTSLNLLLISSVTSQDFSDAKPILNGHKYLAQSLDKVEGTFKVYQDKRAVDYSPGDDASELGLPLLLEGYLWKSGDNFRLRYIEHKPDKTEDHVSIAVTDEASYEFTPGMSSNDAMLRVSDIGTAEAEVVRDIGKSLLIRDLDILWSVFELPIVDLLQRPDVSTDFVELPGGFKGYEIIVAMESNSEARYLLASKAPFQLIKASNRTVVGSGRYAVDISVESSSAGSLVLPKQILHISSMGSESQQSRLIEFDLKRLAENSEAIDLLNENSFTDMGISYQVYHIRRDSEEEVGRRIGGTAQLPNKGSSSRAMLLILVVNGCIAVALLLFFSLKHLRRPK